MFNLTITTASPNNPFPSPLAAPLSLTWSVINTQS
jgi:hypothetical protein